MYLLLLGWAILVCDLVWQKEIQRNKSEDKLQISSSFTNPHLSSLYLWVFDNQRDFSWIICILLWDLFHTMIMIEVHVITSTIQCTTENYIIKLDNIYINKLSVCLCVCLFVRNIFLYNCHDYPSLSSNFDYQGENQLNHLLLYRIYPYLSSIF